MFLDMFVKSLVLPSKLESINLVEKVVDEISERECISSDLYGKILVAVVEAVNNAVSHGNKFEDSKQVKVDFNCQSKLLRVVVEDQGSGFNPDIIPDPTRPENLENISGRGIFIMKSYADQIEFNKNATQVTLSFNL